jgi:hypothetical protein
MPKQDLKPLIEFAVQTYQEIAPDLMQAVPFGQGYYHAAHDHIADRLYDQFHATHKDVKFRSVAKAALKDWVDDDRVDTRKNEDKLKRRAAAAKRPARVKKAKTPKLTWWQELGYTVKPRKGIGSY